MDSQPQTQQSNLPQNTAGNPSQPQAGPSAFSSIRLAFIVDTSVSMSQRTSNGMSLLDVAKMAADRMVSSLCRQGGGHGRPQIDRCVLFNGRGELVTGLSDPFPLFTKSLMHLEALGSSDLGHTITNVMDAINIQRSGSNGDTFMRGRCPWKSAPWAVFLITDHSACKAFAPAPTRLLPDTEFVDGLFRWDQRLYALVLGLPGVLSNGVGGSGGSAPPFSDGVPDCPAFTSYCADTGGACTFLRSMAHVNAAADALANALRSGVSVGVSCARGGADFKTQVFSPTSPLLFWPFPEDTWIDYSGLTSTGNGAAGGNGGGNGGSNTFAPIPKRGPHPNIVLYPAGDCPRIPEKLPADRYELESPALAEMLKPGACFVACIAGCMDPYQGGFGFLTPSEAKKGTVVLVVLAPGFQRLLRLVEEYQEKSVDWRRRLGEFIKELPLYYHEYLGKALKYIGIYNALPDRSERLIRPDKVDSQVIARRSKVAEKLHFTPASITNLNGPPTAPVVGGGFLPGQRNGGGGGTPGGLGLTGGKLRIALIPRSQLLQEVAALRNRLFFARHEEAEDEEQKHRTPISRMGNFEDYLKRKKELRPVAFKEESPYRKQLFGNPFKKIKFVDEADVHILFHTNTNTNSYSYSNSSFLIER